MEKIRIRDPETNEILGLIEGNETTIHEAWKKKTEDNNVKRKRKARRGKREQPSV